ncbi:MAG: RING finger domain-containing protein, partial [Thermoplasmata archaeon]
DTCDICGEKIEKGEEIVLCSCGNMIHNECALKEKVCPNCGTDLEEVEDVEKEKEVSRRVSLGI